MSTPTISHPPRRARGQTLIAAALIVLAAAPASRAETPAPAAPADIVQTSRGPVAATHRGAMRSWFAIPYAAPPTGERRWRAPEPATPWTVPIARASSASGCLQTGRIFRSRLDSEDCLYLDVHAPAGPGPYPVMVWIHGGAFVTGDAAFYGDPSPLVSKGVIVVALNYRLGAMGFLAHPALRDAQGSSGDYGIMDQQAALRWVRENIAAFGGDPRNVTIFGESAGGVSVITHLASPLSAGLFDKAIIDSGAYAVDGQLSHTDLETRSAAALAKTLASPEAGAAPPCPADKVTAACLRALPEALVRARLLADFVAAVPEVVPSVDGKVLKHTLRETFAGGENHRVPVISGSNESEMALFVALAELRARLTAKPPNLEPADHAFLVTAAAYQAWLAGAPAGPGVPPAGAAGRFYPLSRFGPDPALAPSLAGIAFATDSTFACNGVNVAARIAAQGTPVWDFEFRDRTAPPLVGRIAGKYVLSVPQGAAHAAELQYLFQMAALDPQQTALRETMTRYWVNFARTGDPNGPDVPRWPKLAAGAVQALDIADAGGVKPVPKAAFDAEHQCRTAWSTLTF